VSTSAWLEFRTSLWKSRVHLCNILIFAILLSERLVALALSSAMAVRKRPYEEQRCWKRVYAGEEWPWIPSIWKCSLTTQSPLTDPAGLKLEESSRKAWLLVEKVPAANRDLGKLNLEVNQRFEKYRQHQQAAKSCWTEEPGAVFFIS